MMPKYNHGRFGGDIVKAFNAWSREDQGFDLKDAILYEGGDPNDLETLFGFWSSDQIQEFVMWLFETTQRFRGAGAPRTQQARRKPSHKKKPTNQQTDKEGTTTC